MVRPFFFCSFIFILLNRYPFLNYSRNGRKKEQASAFGHIGNVCYRVITGVRDAGRKMFSRYWFAKQIIEFADYTRHLGKRRSDGMFRTRSRALLPVPHVPVWRRAGACDRRSSRCPCPRWSWPVCRPGSSLSCSCTAGSRSPAAVAGTCRRALATRRPWTVSCSRPSTGRRREATAVWRLWRSVPAAELESANARRRWAFEPTPPVWRAAVLATFVRRPWVSDRFFLLRRAESEIRSGVEGQNFFGRKERGDEI